MADPDHGPDDSAGAIPPAPAKKAPATRAVKAAKKAPAKKSPVKKAPAKAVAKKIPARKAPAKAVKKAPAALTPKPPQPVLEAAAPHAALTAGNTASGAAATPPAAPPNAGIEARPGVHGGRARLPVTMGLAVIGLVAVVLSRFRRG
jgi:hypothetical protein